MGNIVKTIALNARDNKKDTMFEFVDGYLVGVKIALAGLQ